MTTDVKPSNPKDAIGASKLSMHLCPTSAEVQMSLAFLEGALKYGKYNWRVAGVRVSIYLDAIRRHLGKFEDGEWNDPQTTIMHLGYIMACCAIMIDSKHVGNLVDDRPPSAPTAELIDATQATIKHLKELFKDHNPHQCVITDSPPPVDGGVTSMPSGSIVSTGNFTRCAVCGRAAIGFDLRLAPGYQAVCEEHRPLYCTGCGTSGHHVADCDVFVDPG